MRNSLIFLFFLIVIIFFSGCVHQTQGSQNDQNADSNNSSGEIDLNAMVEQCYETCSIVNEGSEPESAKFYVKYNVTRDQYYCLCSAQFCRDDPENPNIVYCEDVNRSFPFSNPPRK